MTAFRFIAAKAVFVFLFLGLTLLQLISFPGQFQHMRNMQGISLTLEISLVLIFGLWLGCGQAALICLWHIVEAMRIGQFFSTGNLLWISRLLLAFKVASIMPAILILLLAPQADDPGFFVMISILMLFIIALTVTTSLLRDEIGNKVNS